MGTTHWRRLPWIAACLLLAALPLALLTPQVRGQRSAISGPAALPPGKFEPGLLKQLLQGEAAGPYRFIVILQEQADLSQLETSEVSKTSEVWLAGQRAAVVAALQAVAERTQADLRVELARRQAEGRVQSFTPFWVVNALAVTADRDTAFALAARPEVAVLREDHWRRYITDDGRRTTAGGLSSVVRRPSSVVEWNIAQIRADLTWSALAVRGEGVVVATLDTGADWLHPALRNNYRGRDGVHTGNWFDATGAHPQSPYDDHGHGTHTLGTLVGAEGIGVAPGAAWIAAKVFNAQGFALDSWIHAAFQWVLAPGGNPAWAPDIVSNSWGTPIGTNETFRPDVQALRAAGIFPIFSAGNDGPLYGTINAPGSYPESFAVGATDEDDIVTNFSSRGPSPWGAIKPEVVAPGAYIRSATPGGGYTVRNGTSMAAPHVAGVAALVWSARPALTLAQLGEVITSTALPLGAFWPNNVAGWGRVDAYAAVINVTDPGTLTGSVTREGSGQPVVGATVRAIRMGNEVGAVTTTDAFGHYRLMLAAGNYQVEVSAFAYAPQSLAGVAIITGTTTVRDVALTPLPAGRVRGQVTASGGGLISATIAAEGVPAWTATDPASGWYTLTLPAGTYTLTARSSGHRVGSAQITIVAGEDTLQHFALATAPTILLVDSGAWTYTSVIDYYRRALEADAYVFANWRILNPPNDLPRLEDLTPYDLVIWSSPNDGPGFVGAGDVISAYMALGGNVILSGQDVGFWDGGGSGVSYHPYYTNRLKARYEADNAPSRIVTGTANGPLAGLSLTISGPGGANNQYYPDVISITEGDHAAPAASYAGDGMAVEATGQCLPYRVLYLAFGFEGINSAEARAQVMQRAIDWIVSPRPASGAELRPATSLQVGARGAVVTHTLRLRHTGEAGVPDTFSLATSGATWPALVLTPTISLAPCAAAQAMVQVEVPADAGWDARDTLTLSVRSAISPSLVVTASLTSKAPAPLLLVDDDRWYDIEASYRAALRAAGVAYDDWNVGWRLGEGQGSPPTATLQMYPFVVWFTGYDWYDPISLEEERKLGTYLEGGGRLFLSSQGYMTQRGIDPFITDWLGVAAYTPGLTTTLAIGVDGSLVGDGLSRIDLVYPFPNDSLGLAPAPGAAPALRGDDTYPIAVARAHSEGRAVFFGFPFETLPAEAAPDVMARVVGWLSALGESSFTADRRAVHLGDVVSFTLTLHNSPFDPFTPVIITNALPSALTLLPGSLQGATYDPEQRLITWSGQLGQGQAHLVTYQAEVGEPVEGQRNVEIANTVQIVDRELNIRFSRQATLRINAPDLSSTTFTASPARIVPNSRVDYTLIVRNNGVATAERAKAEIRQPPGLGVDPASVWASNGEVISGPGMVYWTGTLLPGEAVTITYQANWPGYWGDYWLMTAALLDDGAGGHPVRDAWVHARPYRVYLPAWVMGRASYP